ncbi:MAG: hypothetical protein OXB84_05300 [Halobacteriovoraceae bacterium]|nr:hypothetical protein [Halobacteriovoraceae bacterium]
MIFDKKWIKVLSLALCLPSTIFAMGFFFHKMVENQFMPPLLAIIIFLLVIGNILFFMVWYARSVKNKS